MSDETRDLRDLYAQLGPDERRVLLDIARTLAGKGLKEYGHLNLATDRRNFCREAAEELTDAIVYCRILLTAWADDVDRKEKP